MRRLHASEYSGKGTHAHGLIDSDHGTSKQRQVAMYLN